MVSLDLKLFVQMLAIYNPKNYTNLVYYLLFGFVQYNYKNRFCLYRNTVNIIFLLIYFCKKETSLINGIVLSRFFEAFVF